MKTSQYYKDQAITNLFDEIGAFFAFSDEQFDEQKKEGVKYSHLKHGLICPKGKAGYLIDQLDEISKQAIKLDLEENGKEAIIKRELSNHECYYVGDWSDALPVLLAYGFEEDEVKAIFNAEYPNVEL